MMRVACSASIHLDAVDRRPCKKYVRSRHNMSAIIRTVFVVLSLVFFALNVWFLYFIDHLDNRGCQCAEGWRRKFIEFMLAVFVLLFLIGLFFPIGKYMGGIVALVYFALVVAYIVIVRQFIESLTTSGCKCATDTNAFWWLSAINILQIVVLFLAVLLMLMAILFTGKIAPSSSNKRR